MIKWLLKYGAVIFLFNTILLSINSFIGNQVFLIIIALYVPLLLLNPTQIKIILFHKAFSFFLLLNFINFIYFLLFHSITELDAIKYLLARGLQFSIITISIYLHFDYFKTKFISQLTYLIGFIVIIGLFINPDIFSTRYSGIIWNPIMLASLTVVGFAFLLLKSEEKTNFENFLLFLFFIISITTGSRGVLVGITLAFVIRYGFSIRNMIYAFLGIIFFFLLIDSNLDTSLNRFGSQSLLNNRNMQFYYAFETFLQKPISGWGLDKYSFLDYSLAPYYLKDIIVGAHNGYLAILVQYGLIFSTIIFYIIFSKAFSLLGYFRRKRVGYTAIYSFLIVYTLLASIYETLMTGINEFQTVLFWLSLAMLSFSKYQIDNNEN